MSMVDLNTGPPVSQLSLHAPTNHVQNEENGPENNAEGNISLTPEQKKYLDDAMKFARSKEEVTKSKGKVAAKSKDKVTKSKGKVAAKSKDKVTKCIDKLNDLDKTKSKYKDLHELQRLLKLGKEHEAQLKEAKKYNQLEETKDRKKEKTFPPYCIFGKRVQKSLSHNLKELPEFKVHGNETPTEFVEKCVRIRRKTIEERYKLVEDYLSKYHQDMIKLGINSMMNNLGKKQKLEAHDKLEKHGSGKANPQTPLLGSASVPMTPTRDAAPFNTDSAVTPMLPSPRDKKRPRSDDQLCDLRLPKAKSFKTSESAYCYHTEFSERKTLTKQNDRPQHIRIIHNLYNQPSDATITRPSNNLIFNTTENIVNNNQLLTDLFQSLDKKCGDAIKSLIEDDPEVWKGERFDRFKRACALNIQRERATGNVITKFRTVVENKIDWVVEPEDTGLDFDELVPQVEQDRELNDQDKYKAFMDRVELLAEQVVDKKTARFQHRADVVEKFLSPNDTWWMQKMMKEARLRIKECTINQLQRLYYERFSATAAENSSLADISKRFSDSDIQSFIGQQENPTL